MPLRSSQRQPHRVGAGEQSVEVDREPFVPEGFEVVGRAGRGTFCDIWKVRETADGRVCAWKQLQPEWAERGESGGGCARGQEPAAAAARQLLINEARVAGAVHSERVVALIGCDHDAAAPYNLLEWVEGQTLEARLAKHERGVTGHAGGVRGPETRDAQRETGGDPTPDVRSAAPEIPGRLTVGEALWIARQCAQGLADLARAGFAHGDVKPENILVGASGEVKLADLGFARPLDGRQTDSEHSGEAVPMTGTPEYLAPERLARERLCPAAADMYSLGVTIYRMLAGRLPFSAPTAAAVLRMQRSARPPSLRDYRPEAPLRLVRLVERLLAKQPVRRPHSYDALVRELMMLEVTALPGRFGMPHAMSKAG